MGPWYSGDGEGEHTLDPNYTVDGKRIMRIEEYFQSLNKVQPGPYVVCSRCVLNRLADNFGFLGSSARTRGRAC